MRWALIVNGACQTYHWDMQLSTSLPVEYETLSAMAELLPGHNTPAAFPFQSLVLNINAVTKAHRDRKDYQLCLVIPVGTFEGGELCLLETGLVLDLKAGDLAVFRSSDITHFNLHFQGEQLISVALELLH